MSLIITIGRNTDNDVIILENYISSHHAQLIRDEDGQWFIHDLGSTNGTFVNGEQVTSPVRLHQDDQVLLGGSLLRWKDIYNQYSSPAASLFHPKRQRWKTYALSLAAAITIFAILFLGNELYTRSTGKTPGVVTGKDSTGTTKENTVVKPPKKLTYDLSCVTYADNKDINNLVKKVDSLETAYIDKSGVTVSLQEEVDFGNENHQNLLKGSTVITNGESRHLQDMLHTLAANISNPRGFHYQLFLIDSKEINSWTSGGRIYFTTAMLHFTHNDDEIAGIIGHEINHNELYHINRLLKAQKLAIQKFGDKNGQTISTVNKILTSPFGKKDEAYCDLKGEDLVIAAGYNPCEVVKLWKRMSQMEGAYSPIDNFTRSHPYASTRINCIENHLATNYSITCAND